MHVSKTKISKEASGCSWEYFLTKTTTSLQDRSSFLSFFFFHSTSGHAYDLNGLTRTKLDHSWIFRTTPSNNLTVVPPRMISLHVLYTDINIFIHTSNIFLKHIVNPAGILMIMFVIADRKQCSLKMWHLWIMQVSVRPRVLELPASVPRVSMCMYTHLFCCGPWLEPTHS